MAIVILTATTEISLEWADRLAKLRHDTVIIPFLEVKLLTVKEPKFTPQAVLITSRYALAAAKKYREKPLYVVGANTAEMAEKQGHSIEKVALNVESFADELPAMTLYLRGRDVAQDLDITSRICYQADKVEAPNVLPKHHAVLVLSARAAAQMPVTSAIIFCLSERVRSSLPKSLRAQAAVAAEPTEIAMVRLIKDWSDSPEKV